MTGLTAFLLARFLEDEARWKMLGTVASMQATAAFLLAECEAKQRIVEELSRPSVLLSGTGRRVAEIARDIVLGNLALPYADHPDYREEWKP